MSENMEKVYDVIVVGSGPAGLTAALYCARAGYETLVLEKYIPGGQMVTSNEIENYPGFPEAVDGFTLTMNMKKQAERFGAKQTYGNVTALRLDDDAKILETEDGTVYRAKASFWHPVRHRGRSACRTKTLCAARAFPTARHATVRFIKIRRLRSLAAVTRRRAMRLFSPRCAKRYTSSTEETACALQRAMRRSSISQISRSFSIR